LQRPANGSQQEIQDAPPAGYQNGDEISPIPQDANSDSATYLEPPKLFDPKDRTAARRISPVHTALYEKPISYRRVSARSVKISAEQARLDAAGWTSASN
jgi:hypothetical protein